MLPRSISDDDLCSECFWLHYSPGELSTCTKNWPGILVTNGYVQECPEYKECEPGANWVEEIEI